MSCGIGYRLKAAAALVAIIILLLSAFTCTQAGKADARASLLAYTTKDPNGWEMGGFNVTGTAANYTVTTLGWNATRLMGNVGLGDGSVYALKSLSNPGVNFSEHLFMSGDISTSPWDPSRIVRPTKEIEQGNNTSEEKGIANQTTSTTGEEKEELADTTKEGKEEANTTEEAPATSIVKNIPLDDLYHSILMGRPVDDLLYENPLTISGSAYFRLLGVAMPGGNCVNIGMRTLGYGY
jgi:hypothetical protein